MKDDLELLDLYGPQPTPLSPAATDTARARLETAMAQDAPAGHRSRRRVRLLAAAAAAAVGLALSPALLGSDRSVALAAVDPLTFPLTPTALPTGLGEPVFERDSNFMAARYGPVLDGIGIVTDVEDADFWTVPDDAPTVDIQGHRARVVYRRVHSGTPDHAPAVTVVWHSDDNGWTAVTGSGRYADPDRVAAVAESLREHPQRVDLALGVAPEGWSVVAYKEDRILTLAAPGRSGRDELTVALVDRVSKDLTAYGARDVERVTVHGRESLLGRQEVDADEPAWMLEAWTSSGQAFSLQAPATLTRDQVIRVAEGVTYRP